MEAKVSFDREELENWFNKDCGISCRECPLKGYMCDTLASAAHVKERKKAWEDDDKILEKYYECALKEVADQKEEIEYLKNKLAETDRRKQEEEIEYLKSKLVEASRRIQELEGENLIWTQRCSKAEGKLNRAKNIIAMLTGREEW